MSEPYELNVGRFMRDHPDRVLTAGAGGFGFSAWLRDDKGRPYGQPTSAPTLDELHAQIAAEEQPS